VPACTSTGAFIHQKIYVTRRSALDRCNDDVDKVIIAIKDQVTQFGLETDPRGQTGNLHAALDQPESASVAHSGGVMWGMTSEPICGRWPGRGRPSTRDAVVTP
jgi:hypothetical protein